MGSVNAAPRSLAGSVLDYLLAGIVIDQQPWLLCKPVPLAAAVTLHMIAAPLLFGLHAHVIAPPSAAPTLSTPLRGKPRNPRRLRSLRPHHRPPASHQRRRHPVLDLDSASSCILRRRRPRTPGPHIDACEPKFASAVRREKPQPAQNLRPQIIRMHANAC